MHSRPNGQRCTGFGVQRDAEWGDGGSDDDAGDLDDDQGGLYGADRTRRRAAAAAYAYDPELDGSDDADGGDM
jgi:hypothetical protein